MMKTMPLLIVVIAFFVFANSTHARIGEPESKIDDRYGKPAGKWDDYLGYKKLYHWHGFDVMVTFADGVSRREMFVKTTGPLDAHVQKHLAKMEGAERNGVIFDPSNGVFTTKEFEEKYLAARNAAWAKSDEKQ
ncbi:MAG: hypothetical protein JO201_01605 [Verrucomicrobia bacterium]|nr:hypothetical protein [Verrucomicrobiota bacterium]